MDSRAHHPTDAGVLPRRFGSVLLVISISLTVPALVSGQSARLSIDHLSFLTGCWAGTMGTLDMQEQWSELERGGRNRRRSPSGTEPFLLDAGEPGHRAATGLVTRPDSALALVGDNPQDRATGQEGALTSAQILRHPSEQGGDLYLAGSLCPDRRPEQKTDPFVHVHHHHPRSFGSNPTPPPNLTSPYGPPHVIVSCTRTMTRDRASSGCTALRRISESRGRF